MGIFYVVKDYCKDLLSALWDFMSEDNNGRIIAAMTTALTTLYVDLILVVEWFSFIIFGQVTQIHPIADWTPYLDFIKDIVAIIVGLGTFGILIYNTVKKKKEATATVSLPVVKQQDEEGAKA